MEDYFGVSRSFRPNATIFVLKLPFMEKESTYIENKIPVPSEFEDVFSYFYLAKNMDETPIHKTLFPTYQTILVFSFGEKASLTTKKQTTITIEKCLVLGPIRQPIEYVLPANSEILVANFKGDAFYRFFGKALISDTIPVHPDDLVDENCFTLLWHSLKDRISAEEKVASILDFSRPYLKNRELGYESISNFDEENLDPIKTIADKTNQSERNVQLNFKKYLGFSAKEINRYRRFIKALELLNETTEVSKKADWIAIVETCGYYDQSQLIHDFKHYLGLSPTKFLKFQEEICIPKMDQVE